MCVLSVRQFEREGVRVCVVVLSIDTPLVPPVGLFQDLRKLLAVKARLCRDAVRGGRAEDGGAASGFASFDEIGGAVRNPSLSY